jgi:hypothetical protein
MAVASRRVEHAVNNAIIFKDTILNRNQNMNKDEEMNEMVEIM